MPNFAYTALDAAGTQVAGVIEAGNDRLARTRLREQGLRALTVEEKAGGGGLSMSMSFGKKKVKFEDRSQFTRQMATLLDAGLPLLRGLTILIEQAVNPTLKEILEDVKTQIQAGSSFSEALARHPAVFDKLYVAMVRAGEAGGVIEVVLDRLADFAERDQQLRNKVKSAMVYPAIMVMVAVIVVTILMAFVIPQFSKLFLEMGVELPLPTRILISISDVVKTYWWLGGAGAVGAWYGFKAWAKTPSGERAWDTTRLKLPLFGELQRKSITARFTRTLGTLIQSGVPILQALEICKDTAGNVVVGEAMEYVAAKVQAGESLAIPHHSIGIFAPMVTNMIAVGEETGALDAMLNKIADNYDLIVEETVKGLTSLMEPALIVTMGVVVGFIVLALFMPLFDLTKGVKA